MKFSRQARLSGAADYRSVFAQSQPSRDSYFRVLSRPNGRDNSRLGLAVSKRACRSAVGRNRLKRITRESFRVHQDVLIGGLPRDIVVLPTPLAATISNRDLFESLEKHWRKVSSFGPLAARNDETRQEKRGIN